MIKWLVVGAILGVLMFGVLKAWLIIPAWTVLLAIVIAIVYFVGGFLRRRK